MAFEWSDNLALAVRLYRQAGHAENEAQLRCVIGRAYYAAFGTAADYLRAQGEVVSDKTAHYDVWSTFQRFYLDSAQHSIGILLQKMLRTRKAADYDNPYKGGNLKDDADEMIARAELVLSYLEQLRAAQTPE